MKRLPRTAALLVLTSLLTAAADAVAQSTDVDARFETMQREIEQLRSANADMQRRLARQEAADVHAAAVHEQRAAELRRLRDGVLREADARSGHLQKDARLEMGFLQDDDAGPATDEGFQTKDQSGNDPRGFDNKFMPYYRYTDLKNNLRMNEFTLFGMFAFSPRFAMTYEWPMAKKMDVSGVEGFKERMAPDVLGQAQGTFPSTGLPANVINFVDADGEGDEVGMGDLNLRFFVMPEQLQWDYKEGKNLSLMPVLEMTLPTATDEILGGEAFVLSPGVVVVADLPFKDPPFGLGLVALMNFYDFDAWKDSGRSSISRFRGRWFYMQPLSKPTDEFSIFDLSGLYVMVEAQPIYDFIEGDFDFWLGPEFGKILQPGFVLYAKPGWSLFDIESEDRDFTFEVGTRIFF